MVSDRPSRSSVFPIVAGVMVVLACTGFFAARHAQQQTALEAKNQALTPEAKAYTHFLKLADVEMIENVNSLEQRVIEVTGKVTNTGSRPVNTVAVTCIFYDLNNVEIHRERSLVVKPSGGPFLPNSTRTFRLPFDTVPQGWNQHLPQMFIAQIAF